MGCHGVTRNCNPARARWLRTEYIQFKRKVFEMQTQRRPFPLPGDIQQPDPLKNYFRGATALAIAHVAGDNTIDETVTRLWPKADHTAITRAATAPASTTGWGSGLAATGIGPFLHSLRPRSAAARLFDEAVRINMSGVSVVNLPRNATNFPEPSFTAEGEPIRAVQGDFTAAQLGPPKKMAYITGLTESLQDLAAEDATLVIRESMEDASARALDAAVFSTAAASAARPAGLLAGLTPITATSGGGVAAMSTDVKNLIGALADAGGGTSVMLFANPRQAVMIQLLAGASFNIEIVPTAAVAAGTVVAVEVDAIASGFSGLPQVDISKEAVIHWENSAPLNIGTAGPTVAAPTRSGWQQNLLALRLILRCAWTVRTPGAVAVINSTTW
jgi:hypothetical protein